MKPVLVFDLNETLLNVKVLEPAFQRTFGTSDVLKEWFDTVLLYSQTATILGEYQDFSELAKQALRMVSSAKKLPLDTHAEQEIVEGMLSLPAYPEVRTALQQLNTSGFRLAALTNSAERSAKTQLKYAELSELFDRVLSVDAVQRFKPAPETYSYAASELKVLPSEMVMIASHPWDIQGAVHAGMRGAFLNREGTAWFKQGLTPEFTAPDLAQLAEAFIEAL
ncbi:MAG: haloacid dehalogenase type II [Janthinobacterium lividum]